MSVEKVCDEIRHCVITASTISRLGAECRGRAKLRFSCRNEKQVPNGYMCLLLLTQNWILIDGSFIECISLLVLQHQNDSLR